MRKLLAGESQYPKKEVSDWPIKKTFHTNKLKGELVPKSNFLQQLIDNPYAQQIAMLYRSIIV